MTPMCALSTHIFCVYLQAKLDCSCCVAREAPRRPYAIVVAGATGFTGDVFGTLMFGMSPIHVLHAGRLMVEHLDAIYTAGQAIVLRVQYQKQIAMT